MSHAALPLHSPTQASGQGVIHRPAAVEISVGLMRVQALLALLAIPGIWVYRYDIVEHVRSEVARSGRYVDPAVMSRVFYITVALIVVAAVGLAALWLWMAVANRRGRYFGRVTVGFLLLLALSAYVVALSRGWPSGSPTLVVSYLVINLVVVVALNLPASRRFHRAMSARRGYR